MFHRGSARSLLYRALFGVERVGKELLFGCHSCGQCAVRSTLFICPMQCPKQLRNGPCGGSDGGRCEAYPDRDCVWARIYQRARRWGRMDQMNAILPAPDWSLFGTSAWANLLVEKKIDAKGRALSESPWRALCAEERARPEGENPHE